ncbi:hypothetical protein [Arsenophonus apicola]|uniref:hypothetical protein n=1 Tax=Arsenophonus apicola TaxID=2879119 RepID=UPI00387A61EF
MVRLVWRWENDARWYEAALSYDLFGDLLLIQRWGGLGNHLHGQKTEIVPEIFTGIAKLHAIDRQRRKRKNPYHRIK